MQLSFFDDNESDDITVAAKEDQPVLVTAEYLDSIFAFIPEGKWPPSQHKRHKHFHAIGDVATRDAITLEYTHIE